MRSPVACGSGHELDEHFDLSRCFAGTRDKAFCGVGGKMMLFGVSHQTMTATGAGTTGFNIEPGDANAILFKNAEAICQEGLY